MELFLVTGAIFMAIMLVIDVLAEKIKDDQKKQKEE
jgi:hypothetical protein